MGIPVILKFLWILAEPFCLLWFLEALLIVFLLSACVFVCILQPLYTSQTYMTFSLRGWGERVCLIVIVFKDTIPLHDLHLGSKGKKKYWGEEKSAKTSLPKQKCSPNAFSFSFYKKSKTRSWKRSQKQSVFQDEPVGLSGRDTNCILL